MSFASLRFRLLIGAAAFILVALALSAIGLTTLFQRHVEQWVDGELTGWLDQLIAGLDFGPGGTTIVARPPADPRFEQPMSGLYWEAVIEPDGTILRSRSLWDYTIPLPSTEQIAATLHHHRVAGPGGSTLYLVQRRVQLPARLGKRTARVAIAIDAAAVNAATRRFGTALVPFLLILAALLTAAAWAQIGIGLRPLAATRRKLAAIGAGERDRLGAGFPDEVQPLASEIDSLLAAREHQIERARARAADLAHGLKTPLQVLLSDAGKLKEKGELGLAAEVESVVNAMRRQVERQLSRARIGAFNASSSAEVGEIATQVVQVMSRTPRGQQLTWAVDIPAGMKARIDRQDLAEALGNLVENAARYARSIIRISAEQNSDIVIAVVDDGPGIPVEQWDEMLERGTRLDQSSSGTGLGLAIVTEIAKIWGAKLSFENSDRFGIRFSIPKAAATTLPTETTAAQGTQTVI